MFNNQRFITKGIEFDIPVYLQNIMWYMIETMKAETKDYLQVFKLERVMVGTELQQKITHTQEQPEYKYEYTFKAENPVNAKIFIIDDKTHSTMLLAEEY
jgi:hypothetical protein